MSRALRGLVVAFATIIVMAAGSPGESHATAPCSLSALASTSGSADLTGAREWHVMTSDRITLRFLADPEDSVKVGVHLFGILIPATTLANRSAYGVTSFRVADYSRFGRRLDISLRSSNCTIDLLLVVDDARPLTTISGVTSAVLLLLGWLLVLAATRLGRRVVRSVLAGVGGLLVGLGISLLIQQSLLDPASYLALLFAVAGLPLGILAVDSLRRGWRVWR